MKNINVETKSTDETKRLDHAGHTLAGTYNDASNDNPNEILDCLNKYFETIIYFGNKNLNDIFNEEFVKNLVLFDAPDAYTIVGNKIYIFEHFRIDASKHVPHGGSSLAMEVKKDYDKEEIYHKTGTNFVYHGQLDYESSSNDYLVNLEKSFSHHYSRIDKYKENVLNKINSDVNYEISVNFIIEDIEPFGTIKACKNGFRLVLPIDCKEFLDLFEASIKIDNVFCCTQTANNDKKCVMVSRDDIPLLRETQVNMKDCDVVNMKPMTMSCGILVKIKE